MDTNGLPIEGFQSINLTAGLGAAPPLSASMQVPVVTSEVESLPETDHMTESEMERIILEYKAAQNAKEAEEVLDKHVPDGQMSRVLDGLENDFFS